MPSLTIFRILDGDLPGQTLERLNGVLEPDALDECAKFDYADPVLTGRLFVPRIYPRAPDWAGFVQQGFPDAPVELGIMNQALLVASVRHQNRASLFAIAFGHARHLIRAELLIPTFGRRLALNLLYEPSAAAGKGAPLGRIRQVDARTVEPNTRRSRIQRSRDTSFEEFDVDVYRTLLDRVVGVPTDTATYGQLVSGASDIHLNVNVRFDELGPLLRNLLVAHGKTTYREHFSWIDKITPVEDPVLRERLREWAAELVREGSADLDLAPPEIIDWNQISGFAYGLGPEAEFSDLRVGDYLVLHN